MKHRPAIKRTAAVILSAVLLLATLTACGSTKPKNAADAIQQWIEKDEGNYRMRADMSMEISVKADAGDDNGTVSVDIPAKLTFDIDRDGENAHGDMEITMSMMGETQTQALELFLDNANNAIYVAEKPGTTWAKQPIDEAAFNPDDFTFTYTPDRFEKAGFEFDKDSGKYYITTSIEDIMSEDEAEQLFLEGGMDVEEAFDGISTDAFLDKLMDSEIKYTLDAETGLLEKIELDDISISTKQEESGYQLDISLTMSFEFKFSEHGQIDEIEIPPEVSEAAISSDDNDTGITYDRPSGSHSPEASTPEKPEDTNSDNEQKTDGLKVSGSMCGNVNGIVLKLRENDFETTFGADGWDFDMSSDGEYSFTVMQNPKYPDTTLYLYTDKDTAFAEDVKQNGFDGYSIACQYDKNKPNMHWNGVTFGAGESEITAIYGPCNNIYTCDLYTSLQYDLDNRSNITFYVYNGSDISDSGLQKVEVWAW